MEILIGCTVFCLIAIGVSASISLLCIAIATVRETFKR